MDTATPLAPPRLPPQWSESAPDQVRAAQPHLPDDLEVLRQSLGAQWAWIAGRDGLHLARSGEGSQVHFEQATAAVQGLWSLSLEAADRTQRGAVELLSLRTSQARLFTAELNATALLAVLLPEPAPEAHKVYTMARFAEQHADVRAVHDEPVVRVGSRR